MSGAEVAALRLGTTVAKAAAQMWLGGKRREQERRLDMAELVRLRVPGLRFQRGVQRQFEEIADAVYDRLAPFLEREFPGLQENGRQAVVDAVCGTFAVADLSDEAFLGADANPAEIVRRVTAAVRPPPGFGEAEGRLFELLFAECVEYYVRIVRGLPVFEARALSELLARTTSLVHGDRPGAGAAAGPFPVRTRGDGPRRGLPAPLSGAGQHEPGRGGAVPAHVGPGGGRMCGSRSRT
ncbi:hypothetical protein GCM10017687_51950 [Streptomyces echinatus]|uniref:NACHT N-terminal Helical domain 1-containing protein n=1 Tax=Streptomyces echinatus TaxID=67293 RepID=UPI0031E6D1EA